MKIKADYHTHSTFSKWYHARNTIDQMAEHAKQLGLSEVAITDHGPKHLLFGICPSQIEKGLAQAKKASEKHGIKVWFGVEANLIGGDGTIDLTDEQIEKIDILNVGYHKVTKCDFIKFFGNKNRESAEQIEKNTQAYVNAINKYNIAIVTHLNEYIKVDVAKVAKACAQRGTLIEFNRKHIRFNEDDAKALVESGVNFVISSDAHKKGNIAVPGRCLEFIEKNSIPLDRILNLSGAVEFKKPIQDTKE